MLEIPRIEELEMEGKECVSLRPLWEDVFWEEPREFTDYYFEEKAANNHAFALRIGEDMASMLYLSPYPLMLRRGNGFAELEINYIVGVATKEKYRHRGYMDRILRSALAFMGEKGQPFTFLMPADPKIYRPYDFTYIYDREIYLPKEFFPEEAFSERHLPGRRKPNALDGQGFRELAEYGASYLAKNYDVFFRRDTDYYRGMEKELKAQNGGIYLLYGRDGAMEGYFFYTEEDGKGEIQEAVLSGGGRKCPVCAAGRKQPAIMARIVDVQAMFSFLRTKSKDISWTVRVRDSILCQNDGIWQCRITPDRAFVCKGKEAAGYGNCSQGAVPDCEAGIGQLASWIFGYRKAEECFLFPRECRKKAALRKLEEIKRPGRVFINEIV